MSYYKRLCAVAAVALGSLLTGSLAQASPLQDYNLIVFEDLTSSTNVAGKSLIGGDVNGSAADFAVGLSSIPAGEVSLQVGGNVNLTNLNLNNGSAEIGGAITGNLNNNGGGTVTTGVPLDISAVQSQLEADSTYLAGLAANSSVSLPGTQPANVVFNASPNAQGWAIFDVNGDDIFSNNLAQSILLNANGANAILINVRGSSVTFDQGNMGAQFNTTGITDKILWNFPEAMGLSIDVTINRELFGSVLAPTADMLVQGAGNGISGSVAVKSLVLDSQVHLPMLSVDIPEPATAVLLALGLVAPMARRRSSR